VQQLTETGAEAHLRKGFALSPDSCNPCMFKIIDLEKSITTEKAHEAYTLRAQEKNT